MLAQGSSNDNCQPGAPRGRSAAYPRHEGGHRRDLLSPFLQSLMMLQDANNKPDVKPPSDARGPHSAPRSNARNESRVNKSERRRMIFSDSKSQFNRSWRSQRRRSSRAALLITAALVQYIIWVPAYGTLQDLRKNMALSRTYDYSLHPHHLSYAN